MQTESERQGRPNGQIRSVLITDDDQLLRESLARSFQARGCEVRTAACYDDAIAIAASWEPDLAVVDLWMPEHTGLEVLDGLRQLHPALRMVLLSGNVDLEEAVDAAHAGAVRVLRKPAGPDQILAALERNVEPRLGPAAAPLPPGGLAAAEWIHIQRVLAACDGNVSHAAMRLEIDRRTLQRRLRKGAGGDAAANDADADDDDDGVDAE